MPVENKYLSAEECKDMEFNFPVCLKSRNSKLFWRYGYNGTFEQISLDKFDDINSGCDIPNCAFVFGRRFEDYHNNKFDKGFLNRIIELNEIITEDEFITQMERYFELYKLFLSQSITSEDTQTNGTEEKEEEMPF
jgi:hypothetical protein